MSFKYSIFSDTGLWPSQKATPKTSEFPTRLRKFCFSEVSHLWDRCQRWSAARTGSGCSSGEIHCPALGSSEATKAGAEQEISALPCRGNHSATSRYFGNICSLDGILFASLASNLGKKYYSWMSHPDLTTPGTFLRQCLSIYNPGWTELQNPNLYQSFQGSPNEGFWTGLFSD